VASYAPYEILHQRCNCSFFSACRQAPSEHTIAFTNVTIIDVIGGAEQSEDISSRLADALREWIGTAEQQDDLTFVVVTVN